MAGGKRTSKEVAATLEKLRREISREKTGRAGDEGQVAPPEAASGSDREREPGSERGVIVTPPPGSADPPVDRTPPSTARRRGQLFQSRKPRRGGLSSRQARAGDKPGVSRVVDELLAHRKKGRGRIIGIAGLPRHGKTTLADRLRERAAERPGADLSYNKTERGEVNVYYIPGRRSHHALVDMAGEDYQVLGNYDRELPELLEAVLWPVLQKVDGLALLMALPIVWSGWNDDDREGRRWPTREERREMSDATRRMLDAHRMLLKYAVVARDLRRLRRRLPQLGLRFETPPTRDQVDDAFQAARRFDRPVSVVLSKADLYVGRERTCLHTPNLPRLDHRVPLGLRPGASDPLLVAAGHFPDFLDFLRSHVRHFKWSFCQALEDRSEYPSPLEAEVDDTDVSSLVGGEAVVDFLTSHPWSFPGISSDTAIRLDRRLRRDAWNAALVGAGRG